MKKKVFVFFILTLWFCSVAQAITSNTCSVSDVATAISSASVGDTVIVKDGDCQWDTALTITKGIVLQGGIGTIKCNTGSGYPNYCIRYRPAIPANNDAFRMTGFTIDSNNQSYTLELHNSGNTYPQTKVRIDNNIFNNTGTPWLQVDGPIYGVFDSNTIRGSTHTDNYGQNSCSDWALNPFAYGNANNFYYEDNTFEHVNVICTGGHGGRYVYRYNDFINQYAGTISPIHDMHGNQPSGVTGPRGGEVYGNHYTTTNGGVSSRFMHHRGGEMLVFFNRLDNYGATSFVVQQEYANSISCSGAYHMEVKNSYYWNNRRQGNLFVPQGESSTTYYSEVDAVGDIAENENYWFHQADYNGTTVIGVYCGASLPSHCTTGDGAWITDQDCSQVSADNVGRNPTAPILGALYKCESTDTWSSVPYYEPYEYPHPLIAYFAETPTPAAPTKVRIIMID